MIDLDEMALQDIPARVFDDTGYGREDRRPLAGTKIEPPMYRHLSVDRILALSVAAGHVIGVERRYQRYAADRPPQALETVQIPARFREREL
ncbi:MAG: hypothetical protein VW547_02140 [Alphaproteobacteria bacterium]